MCPAPQGLLFVLRPVGDVTFSEHADFDHASFAVASRASFDRVAPNLTQAGIQHGLTIDLTDIGIAALSF